MGKLYKAKTAIAAIAVAILFAVGIMPVSGNWAVLANAAYAEEETDVVTVLDKGGEAVEAKDLNILPLAMDGMDGNESFDSVAGGGSPYSVDTGWLHYRSDGVVSYSRQTSLGNPNGASALYDINAWGPGEEKRMTALFANADSIAASYGIAGDNKRALIQAAIWAVESDMEPLNPSLFSITSLDPNMASALQMLYYAAMGGFKLQAGSVEGLDDGGVLFCAASFDGGYARYGPFTVSGANSASIAAADAPAGSYFGKFFGEAIDPVNLVNGQQVYFFIPRTCGTTVVPKIAINMEYDTFTVTKYSGLPGYKDQIVFEPSGNKEVTNTGTCLGFGEVEILKVDELTGETLSGAEFVIEQWVKDSSEWIKTKVPVIWDKDKRTYFTGLLCDNGDPESRVRIREVSAPYSYLGGWSMEVSFNRQYGVYSKVNATNKPVYLKINMSKLDRDTDKGIAQGDATLAGAVYGLYMNEDREHPDRTQFVKGQKIAEAKTDVNGIISFENLFPAKYYVKEISPSGGYLLDDTVYEVDGVHGGDSESITFDITVTEQVEKQKFSLAKLGVSEDGQESCLTGAGFKVYLINGLKGVKDGKLVPVNEEWSGADFDGYDFEIEPTAKIDGTNSQEMFTDAAGILVSPELPYGEYVVVETTAPEGYLPADPFIVMVYSDSREAQPQRIIEDKAKRGDIPYTPAPVQKPAIWGDSSPKTGDGFNLAFMILILCASAVTAAILVKRIHGRRTPKKDRAKSGKGAQLIKKLLAIFTVTAIALFSFVACASENKESIRDEDAAADGAVADSPAAEAPLEEGHTEVNPQKVSIGSVVVGASTVDLTLPPIILGMSTGEENLAPGVDLADYARRKDFISAKWNKDLSITVTMTTDRYKKYQTDMSVQIEGILEGLLTDTYVVSIEKAPDYKTVSVVVDRAALEEAGIVSAEGLVSFYHIPMLASYINVYRMFVGVDNEFSVTVSDSETGVRLCGIDYPLDKFTK